MLSRVSSCTRSGPRKLPLRGGRLRLDLGDYPHLLLVGFLLVSPLHLSAQPARGCPTRFCATLYADRCPRPRMRYIPAPAPANGPRRRAGIETAVRHTKDKNRKTHLSPPAPAGGSAPRHSRGSDHHPRLWRRHTYAQRTCPPGNLVRARVGCSPVTCRDGGGASASWHRSLADDRLHVRYMYRYTSSHRPSLPVSSVPNSAPCVMLQG